jgi:hypothetical protein
MWGLQNKVETLSLRRRPSPRKIIIADSGHRRVIKALPAPKTPFRFRREGWTYPLYLGGMRFLLMQLAN